MTKKYPINEMFMSIQGEGPAVGVRALFVRFAGCNRDCLFCDTNHAKPEHGDYTLDELVEHIKSEADTKDIILTGGEPMMFLDLELLFKLKMEGFFLHLETNGDYPIPENFHGLFNVICIAPKSVATLKKVMGSPIPALVGIKLLVPHFTPLDIEAGLTIAAKEDVRFTVFIMSVNDMETITPENDSVAMNLVRINAQKFPMLDIRYGVQLHKLIGVK